AMDGHAEEPGARPGDLGEVGDRGLLDAVEGQLAAAGRAGRLLDGDLDRRLGGLLGGRRLAGLERPPPGLAAGPRGRPGGAGPWRRGRPAAWPSASAPRPSPPAPRSRRPA